MVESPIQSENLQFSRAPGPPRASASSDHAWAPAFIFSESLGSRNKKHDVDQSVKQGHCEHMGKYGKDLVYGHKLSYNML
jgi:hypothetical protein